MTPLAVLRSQASPVVLVDGRSGAGKTAYATALAAAAHAALLHLDEVCQGWDGLEAAAGALARALRGRRSGAVAAMPGWDWPLDRPGPRRILPPTGPLVVEGCGAITRASAPLADLRIWLDAPEGERRRRALERDGEAFAPHWERWARQERRLLAREESQRRADLVLDGASSSRSLAWTA